MPGEYPNVTWPPPRRKDNPQTYLLLRVDDPEKAYEIAGRLEDEGVEVVALLPEDLARDLKQVTRHKSRGED